MPDEPLTPTEQEAFKQLPRELAPPNGLEERVVRQLEADGRLRLRRRRGWLPWAAAALVVFTAGISVGRLTAPASPGSPTGTSGAARAERQYLLLLYGAPGASRAEEAARAAEYAEWAREQERAGRLVGAERLADAAAVLGPEAPGSSLTSEPAGFFLIRAGSADEALVVARNCPHLRYGGTVVVRPIMP